MIEFAAGLMTELPPRKLRYKIREDYIQIFVNPVDPLERIETFELLTDRRIPHGTMNDGTVVIHLTNKETRR